MTSIPSTNFAPEVTAGRRAEPFNVRQFLDALSISLKVIVRHATRLPHPLVFAVQSRTVANVDSIGLVMGRRHYPLIRIGETAFRYIARQIMMRPAAKGIEQERYENSWLIPRLGLDRYPIEVVAPQRIPRRNCLLCLCPE